MDEYRINTGFAAGAATFEAGEIISHDDLVEKLGGEINQRRRNIKFLLGTNRLTKVGAPVSVVCDPSPAERLAGLDKPASVLAQEIGPASIPVPVAPAPTVSDAKAMAAGNAPTPKVTENTKAAK